MDLVNLLKLNSLFVKISSRLWGRKGSLKGKFRCTGPGFWPMDLKYAVSILEHRAFMAFKDVSGGLI